MQKVFAYGELNSLQSKLEEIFNKFGLISLLTNGEFRGSVGSYEWWASEAAIKDYSDRYKEHYTLV